MTMKVYARGHRKAEGNGWKNDLDDHTRSCNDPNISDFGCGRCGDRRERFGGEDVFKIQNCNQDKKSYMPNSGRFSSCVYIFFTRI